MDLTQVKTWIFDCDGVLLDSNPLKTEAFYEVALPFGKNYAEELALYHQEHGGISRYRKIDHLFDNMLKRPEATLEKQAALLKFGQLCLEKLKLCPETIGASAMLSRYPSKTQAYVVSGGDQTELREVFANRSLGQYFQGIYGSPSNKEQILNGLIKHPEEAVSAIYVGDSFYDFKAARAFGIPFIFMYGYTEFSNWQSVFQEYPEVMLIRDLRELT